MSRRNSPGTTDRVQAGNGLAYPELELQREDGNPILPGTLYLDGDLTLRLKEDDGIPLGFDWYGAWL
jgi:hypothetical protein